MDGRERERETKRCIKLEREREREGVTKVDQTRASEGDRRSMR